MQFPLCSLQRLKSHSRETGRWCYRLLIMVAVDGHKAIGGCGEHWTVTSLFLDGQCIRNVVIFPLLLRGSNKTSWRIMVNSDAQAKGGPGTAKLAWLFQSLPPGATRLSARSSGKTPGGPCRGGHNGGTWYPREVAT